MNYFEIKLYLAVVEFDKIETMCVKAARRGEWKELDKILYQRNAIADEVVKLDEIVRRRRENHVSASVTLTPSFQASKNAPGFGARPHRTRPASR